MFCRTLGAVVALALTLPALSGCKPPATDDYTDRARIGGKDRGPSEPIGSPDIEGALWAQATKGDRIIYGKPGQAPLFALECVNAVPQPLIAYTRFAAADAGAKAILALIGNGHVERLFADAEKQANDSWLWAGSIPAHDPRLEVLTGRRQVEATIPGAGSVIFNPSNMPGELIARCRALAPPPPAEPRPAATPSVPADPG